MNQIINELDNNNVWSVASRWDDNGNEQESLLETFKHNCVAFVYDFSFSTKVKKNDLIVVFNGIYPSFVGLVLSSPKRLGQLDINLVGYKGENFNLSDNTDVPCVKLYIPKNQPFFNFHYMPSRFASMGKYGDEVKRKFIKVFDENEYLTAVKDFEMENKMSDYRTLIKDMELFILCNHNLIMTGAPGTGKTYLARELAKKIIGDEKKDCNYRMVQFHPSYDYSDFVEGIRPTTEAGNFCYREGIFKKFCRKAANDKDFNNRYVFVIDEINRGEISKIFGEVFNAIEPSLRDHLGDCNSLNKVNTQYQDIAPDEIENEINPFKSGFYVPSNVYIIATMNDIDRSVEILDFAFRRRFPSWEITYKDTLESICSLLIENNKNYEGAINEIKNALIKLNEEIYKDDYLGKDYCFGGAYLNNLPKVDFNKEKLWKYFLEPVLKEYLRGLSSQIRMDNIQNFKEKFFEKQE